MATIGLDKLYYAKITEDENGNETYATPVQLAKAMNADLSVELAEATLYADDGAAEIVKEFKNGTLSLGVDDVGASVASDLTGATIDDNHVLISTSEDSRPDTAVMSMSWPGPILRVLPLQVSSMVNVFTVISHLRPCYAEPRAASWPPRKE